MPGFIDWADSLGGDPADDEQPYRNRKDDDGRCLPWEVCPACNPHSYAAGWTRAEIDEDDPYR